MATVATLTIDLVGQSGKLRSELKRANKSTKSWADQTRQQIGSVSKFIAGAAVAGAAALTATYAKAAVEADKLAKTSDKLGLLPEKLTAIQYAGELTGVAVETTNKSLQNMVKVVGEAEQGVGLGVRAFEQLNLSVSDLARLSPDQQLQVIADAMSGLETQTQRVTVATQIFGQRGAGLVNTLALGSDGLKAMEVEANALGITLNRVDLAKIEAANDEFFRAQSTVGAFGKVLAAQTAPLVAALSQEFVNAAKEAGGFGTVAEMLVIKVTNGVAFVADVVNGLKVVWLGVRQAVAEVSNAVVQLTLVSSRAGKYISEALGLENTSYGKAQAEIVAFADSFLATTQSMGEELEKAALAKPPSEKIKANVKQIFDEYEVAAKEVAANRQGIIAPQIQSPEVGGNDVGNNEFDRLVESLRSEEEKIAASYRRRRDIVLANTDIDSEQQQNLLARLHVERESQTQEHLARLGSIEAQWKMRSVALETATSKQKTKLAIGELQNLTAGTAQQSKKMFRINKQLSLANALISTPEAVSGAYAFGAKIGGPVLGAAFGAAAFAAQIAQVNAIRNSTFTGGGAGTTPSSIGTSSVVNSTPVPVATDTSLTSDNASSGTTINIYGAISSNDAEKLLNDMSALINDGDHVLIESTSRNGRELVA